MFKSWTGFAEAMRPVLVAAAMLGMTAQGASAAAQNPELAAHVGEGDDPSPKSTALDIGQLDIDVAVKGDTARTEVTAHFLNSGPTVLEGNFAFDLPPGSVVTGYGLDINGKMVDGVLAGQRQATVTYEARVRHGYDPGLAEVTRSGAFTTRIFPILPGKGRTVRLSFVTPLDPERPFVIPMMTQKPVGAVSIHVSADGRPALQGPEGLALHWSADGSAAASGTNVTLKGTLSLGPVAAPTVSVATHNSGDTFFEIDDAVKPAPVAQTHPAHLTIYWDSSLSRRDADLASEIDLVGRYIAATRPEAVDVVFFSTQRDHVRSFHAPSPGEVTTVLKTTDYQGGTSLKPLFEGGADGACLLFSDGNITVDSYRVQRMACTLSAVSSAKDANRALLDALARKSGGSYADLSVDAPDAALAHLLSLDPRVRGVTTTDGKEVDYVLLPVSGDRIRIVGHMPDKGDIVVALSGAADATRRYTIDPAKAAMDDSLGALWAARHVGEMNATDRPDRDALLALSRRYSVQSPVADFVVFENIEDYVTAGVEPPASVGEAGLAAYKRTRTSMAEQAANAQRERMDEIVQRWDDVKSWWQTQFKPGPRKPVLPRPVGGRVPAQDVPEPNVPAPAMAPPPPPPPPPNAMSGMANSARASDGVQTVIVTAEKQSGVAPQAPQIQIAIAPWNPSRPYIAALNKAKPDAYWSVYRAQEAQFGGSPAFYLDTGEFMFRHGRPADAIRIALNALELPSANTATMMILADRLMRYGDTDRALWLYERILYLEPDLPQPRRNLALALVTRAEATGAAAESSALRKKDYARALDLLNEIVTHPWQGDFDGIEVISLMEANRIVTKLKALGVKDTPLDPRLVAMLDVDLRVLLEWNTDGTDMDLWVDEPTGERAIYSNPRTQIGGRLSNDMRQGYGPEEYLLHRAPDGTYTVRVNVFASDRLNPNGATTVRAHIFRNYGRADEQEQTLELEVSRADSNHVVGTVKVAGNGK